MSERLRLCELARGGRPVAGLAREFGVSPKTAYKWLDRYEREGEEGLRDRPRRPHSCPSATPGEVAEAVRSLGEEHPYWGPRKLHRLLCDRLGEGAPSEATVKRTLSRLGLTGPRTPALPDPPTVGRFERRRPNELWQTDFTAPFSLPDGSSLWPVPVLDDHSRFCLALPLAPAPTTAAALSALVAAMEAHGVPREVLSDRGSAFGTSRSALTAFTVHLWALGAEHPQGRRGHPQTQGKLERFNRTLEEECLRRHAHSTPEEWAAEVEAFRRRYNALRPHEALGGETPATRYRPSEQPYESPDRSRGEIGPEWEQRRVDSGGRIWLLQHHVQVGLAFAGWTVAARHDGEGYWTVSFRGRRLCQAFLAKAALHKPRPTGKAREGEGPERTQEEAAPRTNVISPPSLLPMS